MEKLPIIELFINGEWDYFTLEIHRNGLISTLTNEGYLKMYQDTDCTLDENLQQFYDLLIEHLLEHGYTIIGE